VQASLYRVAQEGLANVLKHAGSAPSVLALRYRPDEVEIEVANEGPGEAAPAGQGPGSRLGLVGIRERVRVFGGWVQAGPRAEGGWDLRAVFPLS
jgi:signal transduction histidine kinase